jgi:hypothetical protein
VRTAIATPPAIGVIAVADPAGGSPSPQAAFPAARRGRRGFLASFSPEHARARLASPLRRALPEETTNMRARATLSIIMGALSLAAATAACSAGDEEGAAESTAAVSTDLVIDKALAFDDAAPALGAKVTATVTYRNQGASDVVIQAGVVAARPPGGSHAGGPYDDFLP